MKKYFALILVIAISSCGGSVDISPEDTYVKFFGDVASLEMKDMIFVNDGSEGLVMFGTRDGEVEEVIAGETFTFIEKNMYLVVTDEKGNPVSEQMFEIPDGLSTGNSHYDEEGVRITAIQNGYLVIGTITNFPNKDLPEETVSLIVYAQLDNGFNLTGNWQAIGDSTNNYVAADINLMDDDGILIAGYTDVNGSNDFFYQKIGGTNPEWSRIEIRPGSDDRLIRALPTKNGQYALFGQTEAFSGDGEGGVNVERTIIDVDGIIQNSLIYGITDSDGYDLRDDIPSDVLERPGGFVIVGTSYFDASTYDPFVMFVDIVGAQVTEVVFDQTFSSGTSGFNAKGLGVVQLQNNDYFVVGSVDNYEDPISGEAKGDESLVVRTDQLGSPIGEFKTYGLLNGNEHADRALKGNDGSIRIGATFDFGGGLTSFALLKTNTDGELKQ